MPLPLPDKLKRFGTTFRTFRAIEENDVGEKRLNVVTMKANDVKTSRTPLQVVNICPWPQQASNPAVRTLLPKVDEETELRYLNINLINLVIVC